MKKSELSFNTLQKSMVVSKHRVKIKDIYQANESAITRKQFSGVGRSQDVQSGSLLVMHFPYFTPLSTIVISYVIELHCIPEFQYVNNLIRKNTSLWKDSAFLNYQWGQPGYRCCFGEVAALGGFETTLKNLESIDFFNWKKQVL